MIFREKRKIMRRLRERMRKNDIKWKIASIIARPAYEKGYAIVLEKLGKGVINKMIERIGDKQLRHRIYQSILRGMLIAIDERAKELGAPIMCKPPQGTSSECPLHDAPIIYNKGSRVGRCCKGGEKWYRDVAAVWNLLLRALWGYWGGALSPSGVIIDGSPYNGSTAAHEPITLSNGLWVR